MKGRSKKNHLFSDSLAFQESICVMGGRAERLRAEFGKMVHFASSSAVAPNLLREEGSS